MEEGVICEICTNRVDNFCGNINELDEVASILAIDFETPYFLEKGICEKCYEIINRFKKLKVDLIKKEDHCLYNEVNLQELTEIKSECLDETECKICKNILEKEELQLLAASLDEHNLRDIMDKHFPEIHVLDPDALICELCIQYLEAFKNFTSNLKFLRSKISDVKSETADDGFELVNIKTEADVKGATSQFMDTESQPPESDSKIKIEESDVVDEATRQNIKTEFETSTRFHKNTTRQRPLKKRLTHKNPQENKKLKCMECSYITKYESHLKSHLLVHKSFNEVETFQCTECVYKTKYLKDLKKHTLTHMNPWEIEMFKCTACKFETKHRKSLRRHVLTHQSPRQVFNCTECAYTAMSLCNVKKHLLTHASTDKEDQLICTKCDFKSNLSNGLKCHLSSHTNLPKFKCTECTFETKYRKNLGRHLLTHERPRKVFQCTQCAYEAINRWNVDKHSLTHNSPDTNVFKCTACSYQTIHKKYLSKHLLIHKDPLEVEMFRCRMCSYKTRRKDHLKKHLASHSKSLDIGSF